MESAPPASDRAADALEPEGEWTDYLQAISGFMNGVGLEQLSVVDYLAYDAASTGCNWRVPAGYGALIAASLPHPIDLRLSTPVQSVELDRRGVAVTTPAGAIHARAAVLTVSTAVLPRVQSGCRRIWTHGVTPRRAFPSAATRSSFWRSSARIHSFPRRG